MSKEDIKFAEKKKTLWLRDKLRLGHITDVLFNDYS